MEIKVQLNEINKRLIERVCEDIDEQTGIDADYWIDVDDILSIMDSLEDKYKDIEEQHEEYKEHVLQNYKPIGEDDNYRFYANTINRLDDECNKMWRFIKEKGLEEEYGEYQG